MKLIDVLVMISKGELKEGTRIKWGKDEYMYGGDDEFCNGENGCDLWDDMYLGSLNEEVEIVELDHFTDVGKMATEKIKELDNYEWQEGDYDYQIEILYRKLNEVIRRINKE